MAKNLFGFVTRDYYINNNSNTVSSIFEISDIALTYSNNKQTYVPTISTISDYTLYSFRCNDSVTNSTVLLTNTEVNNVIKVLSEFTNYLSNSNLTGLTKANIISNFTSSFNASNSTTPISGFDYSNIVNLNTTYTADHLKYTISNVNVEIWTSDIVFRSLYPNYDINIVLPFSNFADLLVNDPAGFNNQLDNFNLLDFNAAIEANKNNNPTTYTKILNIQYKVPNSTLLKNCYFGFNIYGANGNYEFILKSLLKTYLTNPSPNGLNIPLATLNSSFPTMQNSNEFFIIPRWDRIAITGQTSSIGINSQISKAYSEVFDLNKFISAGTGLTNAFMQANSYFVPVTYNNLLLSIVNSINTELTLRDFKTQYPDILTVSTTSPDFSRMSSRTQIFVNNINDMLFVADSNDMFELTTKISNAINTGKVFNIVNKFGIDYISYFINSHQVYLMPKFIYNTLNV